MKGGIYMTIFYAKKWKRVRYILLASFLIVSFVFNQVNSVELKANETLNMYSGSYALMDGDTGRVLTGKNETEAMANASTTKILTCILTLESCDLNDMVYISEKASSQPKVRMGLKQGEKYQLKDLLYGLMLESYNDCAVAIAEHVSGSTEAFAKALNEKAKEIGCTDTYFITPNGLDAEDENGFHHSTAEDLCKIMAYCTWESPKKDVFLEITQTRNYDSFVNRNSFLNQMEGVLTGKTGFTNKAGYCYVAAMEVNGERYCIALLACGWPNNKNYKWKDAKTLFEYGMENYDKKIVKIKPQTHQILIDGFIDKTLFSSLNKELVLNIQSQEKEYQILLNDKEELQVLIHINNNIKAPVKTGDYLGVCRVYVGDTLMDEFPIYSEENIYIWGVKELIHTIFYQFLTFS